MCARRNVENISVQDQRVEHQGTVGYAQEVMNGVHLAYRDWGPCVTR